MGGYNSSSDSMFESSRTSSTEDARRILRKRTHQDTRAKEEFDKSWHSNKRSLAGRCERLSARADFAAWSSLPKWIHDSVFSLACYPSGSRMLQKILREGRPSVQAQVASQLQSHVWEASLSRDANYVVQTCIDVLPAEDVKFVIDEMLGHTVPAAQDNHASRVLEKLIEYCSFDQTSRLVHELTSNAQALCRHNNGNFIVQHILRYGSKEQQSALVSSIVKQGAISLAKHKVGNHVVSCALAIPHAEIVGQLAEALMPAYADLSQHQSGSFVERELKRIMKLH